MLHKTLLCRKNSKGFKKTIHHQQRDYFKLICSRSSFLFIILALNALLTIKLLNEIIKYRTYDGNDINPEILRINRGKIEERKLLLNGTYPRDYAAQTFSYGILYSVLFPEVHCKDILKIGRIFDGGKWLCNPLKIRTFDKCVVYSFGLNNELSFEEELQQISGGKCLIRGFDQYAQKEKTLEKLGKINGTFKQAKITYFSNFDKLEYSYYDILRSYNDKHIEILKVDIEGAEDLITDKIIHVSICQILIEIHGKIIETVDGKAKVVDHYDAKKALSLLQSMSRQGFYLFSYELNIFLHKVAEYSFIHESCFDKYGVQTIIGKYLT